jgi:hypothetical protein
MQNVQEPTKKRSTTRRRTIVRVRVVVLHLTRRRPRKSRPREIRAELAACRRELALGARDTLAALDRGTIPTASDVRAMCEAILEYAAAAAA